MGGGDYAAPLYPRALHHPTLRVMQVVETAAMSQGMHPRTCPYVGSDLAYVQGNGQQLPRTATAELADECRDLVTHAVGAGHWAKEDIGIFKSFNK